MANFHVNTDNKGIGRCEASVRNCPYEHFDTLKEAKDNFERVMESKTISTHRYGTTLKLFLETNSKMAQRYEKIDEILKEVNKEWSVTNSKIESITNKNKSFKTTDRWYELVQQRKNLYYRKIGLEVQQIESMPEPLRSQALDSRERKIQNQKNRNEQWFSGVKENNNYKFHPKINDENEHIPNKVIRGLTGYSEEKVNQYVAAAMAKGMSKTEAYRKAYQAATLRSDKPLLALDINTASPLIKGRIDNGPYSSIIEVGWVKRYHSGMASKKDYRCGISPALKKSEGAGATEVHHITPEMIDGLEEFSKDEKRQKEMLKELENSVLVTHSANFTVSQLSHNLPGFVDSYEKGKIEVVDTREICRFFQPDTSENTREDFITNNGIELPEQATAFDRSNAVINSLLISKNLEPTKVR